MLDENRVIRSCTVPSVFSAGGIFEVSKYKGIPSDVEIVYDPLTKSFKFVAKKEK